MARNPRDTVLTFFNHFKVLEGYSGSFETFADAFLKDECGYYTPFMQNVRGFWEARQEPNITFITYEEMKRDLPSVIRRVSAFLGKPVAERDIPALADFLSFDKMRSNPAMNKQDSVEVRRLSSCVILAKFTKPRPILLTIPQTGLHQRLLQGMNSLCITFYPLNIDREQGYAAGCRIEFHGRGEDGKVEAAFHARTGEEVQGVGVEVARGLRPRV